MMAKPMYLLSKTSFKRALKVRLPNIMKIKKSKTINTNTNEVCCKYCHNIPYDLKTYYPAVYQHAWEWELRFNDASIIHILTIILREMNKEYRFNLYKICKKLCTNRIPYDSGNRAEFPNYVMMGIRGMFPDPWGRYSGFQN